jgi:hypothetical protein
MSTLERLVYKRAPRMLTSQVVDQLDVTFLQFYRHTVLCRCEMYHIDRFCLNFRHGWYARAAGRRRRSGDGSSGEAEAWTMVFEIEEKGTVVPVHWRAVPRLVQPMSF